jgi:hypothetical protein
MEEKQKRPEEDPDKAEEQNDASKDGIYDVVPGVPVVRVNTPRPMPFNLESARTELPLSPSTMLTGFPAEAPDAPPLPEDEPAERADQSGRQDMQQMTGTSTDLLPRTLASEFIWLFEYALGMDPVYLNRPERLDGSAFAYGSAVLKGYRLIFAGLDTRTGHVIASLEMVPDEPEAEVWGILYRVPRRFTRSNEHELPLLDKVHDPDAFVSVELRVCETYRQREVACISYIASEATQQQVNQLPQENRLPEPVYLKRLLQVARRQKLPLEYIHMLEELVPSTIPAARPLPTTPPEQNTEPLPALLVRQDLREAEEEAIPVGKKQRQLWHREPSHASHTQGWLIVFASYVCLLLLGTLLLVVLQGFVAGNEIFNAAFTPLGIPSYVLLYGLLGGCVSCIISLGQQPLADPPAYVVITWFTRPFLGALLATMACLLLNTGIFQFSAQTAQHFALYAIVGALAGFCENKLILRKA